MPYIKFLDTALSRLPASFIFQGRVQRGVKWVYPSPDQHDPEVYFRVGAVVYWYEFKSSSTKREVMSRPHFCGHEPGPRTIFVIEAIHAYDIRAFSFYGDSEGEVRVRLRFLFRWACVAHPLMLPLSHASSCPASPRTLPAHLIVSPWWPSPPPAPHSLPAPRLCSPLP